MVAYAPLLALLGLLKHSDVAKLISPNSNAGRWMFLA